MVPRRQLSSTIGILWWRLSESLYGAASVTAIAVEAAAVVEGCLGWISDKDCLLIAMSEGSLSWALISDLLPVGVVDDDAAAAEGVGVCALFGFFSVSSSSSSFVSCWYISSTIGFHKRTLALMNQFDT